MIALVLLLLLHSFQFMSSLNMSLNKANNMTLALIGGGVRNIRPPTISIVMLRKYLSISLPVGTRENGSNVKTNLILFRFGSRYSV